MEIYQKSGCFFINCVIELIMLDSVTSFNPGVGKQSMTIRCTQNRELIVI